MNNYDPSKSIDANALRLLAQAKNSFVDSWEAIIRYFSSYQWQELLFLIKTILIIISLTFFVLIVFLLVKIYILSKFKKDLKKPKKRRKRKIDKEWIKIENRIRSGTQENFKLAIIEADNLFNKVLKNINENEISNIDEIKQGKKMKNIIIEDKKYNLLKEEAEMIIGYYRNTLKELEVL
ncbi:hypothetical protein KKA23_03550 [Patescibacteria group bacterium]|nr:hypothetical protein [Patescibacteria group bacterium]